MAGGAADAGGVWLSERADYAELALSAWGRWDDELEPVLLNTLARAYMRRQRYEAQVLVATLGEALAQRQRGAAQHGAAQHGAARREVGADEFLRLAGVSMD